MDYLTYVGAAITFGSVIGGIVAGLFAQFQKSKINLLRESINDYKARNEQLEKDNDRLKQEVEMLAKEIEQLKREKRLPLDKLIRLVTKHHDETQESIKGVIELLRLQVENSK